MSAYSGSIQLISGITQKNGGTFALVNAPAVQVDDTGKRLDVRLQELQEAINGISGVGALSYTNLTDRPSIEGVTLEGNKTLTDLGVLDKTLAVENKAADSKAVGDAISTLEGKVVKTVKVGETAYEQAEGVVSLPAYPTKDSLGMTNVENTADADKNVLSATKLATARTIAITGDASGSVSFDGSKDVEISIEVADDSHQHSDASITSLDASKLTGTIDIDRLPKGALERCVVVANDTARFALTVNDVQKGDTVKVTETGLMYFVVDDTKLAEEAGYEVYTAGGASSVPWAGVTGKPDTFTPSAHTHEIADINGLATELAKYAEASVVNAHIGDTTIHITASERTNWNAAYTHSTADHARVDATKTAKSTTNGNILINDAEVEVYKHATHNEASKGLYKVAVDDEGHVIEAVAVEKADITALEIPGEDTGVTEVVANNGLTQSIEDRKLTLGISEVSTDLLVQGANTIIINGGRASVSA